MSEIDTSQFDHITDRVERARAKAEAIKRARAGEGASGPGPGGSQTGGEPGPAEPQAEAVAVAEEPALAPERGPDLRVGQRFRWNGREGEVSDIRYSLVHLTYDHDNRHVVVLDRFRLSSALREGTFEIVEDLEAYRSQRTGSTERVDRHDYVWLETRKGMTAKKKRPRSIAIVNPDDCTGCNACIEVCPTDCIEEVDVAEAGLTGIGHYCEVRLEDCIGCIQCVHMCPWNAIDMVDTDKVEAAYEIAKGTL